MANLVRYRRVVRKPVRIGKTSITSAVTGSVVDLDNPQVREDLKKYDHLITLVPGLREGVLATTPAISNLGNLALNLVGDNVAGGATGVQNYVAIDLPKGLTVSGIRLWSGTTAAGTPTAQVGSLYSSDGTTLTKVATSPDATTAAWAADTEKAFTFTTPYVTVSEGTFYVGWVVAATTAPSYSGKALKSAAVAGVSPVKLSGTAGSGLTDTQASVALSGVTVITGIPYVRVF